MRRKARRDREAPRASVGKNVGRRASDVGSGREAPMRKCEWAGAKRRKEKRGSLAGGRRKSANETRAPGSIAFRPHLVQTVNMAATACPTTRPEERSRVITPGSRDLELLRSTKISPPSRQTEAL